MKKTTVGQGLAPAVKKVLSLFLSLVMLFTITAGLDFSSYATEYSGSCGDNVVWNLDTSTGTLTISGSGNMTNFSYDDGPWYLYRSYIEKVIITSGVTSIGEYAFYNCGSLTSVTIPNSVTNIGRSAFCYCAITSITIPNSVTSIGYYTFRGCSSLTSVTIPNSVTSIGDCAFEYCRSLTSVTIPNSVTSIGDWAFGDCTSLTSIIIPDSVTRLGNRSFDSCTSLTSIIIPDSVTSIGSFEFYSCTSLASITIPNSVTSIGDWAFKYCTSLKDVYYNGSEDNWNKINIGSNNECLTNATIHYNSQSGTTEDETAYIHKSFKSAKKSFSGKYGYYYSDSYFTAPATKYNHHLATMSICTALSTYQREDEEKNVFVYDENIKNLLTDCGFGKYKQVNYDKPTGTDTIGCVFASKKIGSDTLIAVAIRSGGYGAEWSSNVTTGIKGDHSGFDDASSKVYQYLTNYVNSNSITGNVKFWITGFSRGGATANLLAAKLNDTAGTHPSVNYTNDDVYAYTFATPAGAHKSSNPHSSKYNNIFNIIHYHDVVPLVAPSEKGWEFDRYGITKVLPAYENTIRTSPYEKRMKEYLSAMGYTYKVDNFTPTYKYTNDSLGTFNRKFIKSVANNIGGRASYNANYQSELANFMSENGLGIALGTLNEANKTTLIKMLVKEAVFHPYLTTTAVNNLDLMAVVHAEAANYIAWMQSMDSNYVKGVEPYFTNGDYRVAKVNCPVDVYVYDNNNNLVASIIDEIPQDIKNSSIISSIDENGQKVVYLPCDAEYRVEVIARENCETTFTLNECTGVSSDISRVISFNEVAMKKNEVMVSAVDSYSDEEVENGAETGTELSYTTELSDTELNPDLDISGEEVSDYTYTVNVNYNDAQGTVLGGGIFTAGDFCQVTANNNAGYKFEGWYIDNNKVSSDYTYRFAVQNNVTIEARYTVCEHISYSAEKVPQTCTEKGYTDYTCQTCGYSYQTDYVNATGHKYKTTTTKATTKKNGKIVKKCSLCSETITTTIYYPKTITLSKTSYTYNGKAQKPSVTVKDSKGNKIASSNYTVSYSSGRKNVGKYTVTIKLKGNYSGTVKKTFTIVPKSTTVSKVTAGKKAFTVKWKKQATQTTGYQIQYATDSKFTKNKKTVTVSKNKTTSKKISKLKAKKKYYVRVRTYKTVNGTKYYSSWSKAMTVKTK